MIIPQDFGPRERHETASFIIEFQRYALDRVM